MDYLFYLWDFIKGVLFNTDVGPVIVALAVLYLAMKIRDLKQKQSFKHLQTYATIKGRQIIRGSGISIKLKSTEGWKTGVFLGANQDGFLIIKTNNNAKIMVDPNYISDVRVFDLN